MVKIITNGVVKQKQKPWPYGEKDLLTCPKCGCVFVVEESDGYHVERGSSPAVSGICPFCAKDVRIFEPVKTYSFDDPNPIHGRIQ